MQVDSDEELKLGDTDIPHPHTLDGYLRLFDQECDRLQDSIVDPAQCSRSADQLCHLSRFLLFAAIRERIAEGSRVRGETLVRWMEKAVYLLNGCHEHSTDDRVRVHRDHIDERLKALKRRLGLVGTIQR